MAATTTLLHIATRPAIRQQHQRSWVQISTTSRRRISAPDGGVVCGSRSHHTARAAAVVATTSDSSWSFRATKSSSRSSDYYTTTTILLAATVAATVAASTATTSFCDYDADAAYLHRDDYDDGEAQARSGMFQSGHSEAVRFEQCLAYQRTLLPEYRQKWSYSNEASRTPTTTGWPRHVPNDEKTIQTLETDLKYCGGPYPLRPLYRIGDNNSSSSSRKYCNDLRFRIATYYVQQYDSPTLQYKGYRMLKSLAEQGHADGQCMYGIILNEGRVPFMDPNPALAVVWWRRAVDLHRHLHATYELGVALFTGEGCAENEPLALYYFRLAANMGHAGAAYMLGDCLLDGVGTNGGQRDRAEALEWLVTAGELGHRGARSRVLAVLEKKQGDDYGDFTDASRQTLKESVVVRRGSSSTSATQEQQEAKTGETTTTTPAAPVEQQDADEETKWTEDDPRKIPNIERRYTIGGGTRNPVVLQKRKTTVAQSRRER